MRYFLAGTCATIIETLFSPAPGRNVALPPIASTNSTLLLDLRRAAEEEAKRLLAQAVSALGRAENEQVRLETLVTRAEQALAAEKSVHPAGAAEGLARERFRQRLRAQRDRALAQAQEHREGALARARLAETAAAESLRQASLEHQAAERLCERQQAEQRKQTEHRNEQRDEDLVQAIRHHRKHR
jgi:colicin import membrane protein